MKKRKIIIILIIIDLILVSIIYNVINKVIVTNQKQIIKRMSESTQVTELNNQINQLNASHTAYANYIEQSRINLATAITNAGVPTSKDDNFETMINNVSNIVSNKTSDATATAIDILSGKTAWVNGTKITGTMANRGAWTSTPSSSGNVTIPEGYHNGSGYVNTSNVYNSGYNAGTATLTDGKTKIANAITAKGITTAIDADFDTMATNINSITTLNNYYKAYHEGSSGTKNYTLPSYTKTRDLLVVTTWQGGNAYRVSRITNGSLSSLTWSESSQFSHTLSGNTLRVTSNITYNTTWILGSYY